MHLLIFVFIISFLTACSKAPTSAPLPTSSPTKPILTATVTSRTTESLVRPTGTATQTPESEPTQPSTPIPSCIEIFYEEYAQFEIISPQGTRVLVDVYDPGLLSKPASEDDILLTTHTHWDHVNSDFQVSFPGEQLFIESGTIEAGDVVVQGIPSAHNAGDALLQEGGTNYIYLIDTGSLRIAHFGDIGQDTLTSEQLDLLSPVDVAITQIANPYSDMSAENRKGIKLMEQAGPRLIIPTHVNLDSAHAAVAQWPGLYAESPVIELCASDLDDQTQILFLGQSAAQFTERLNLLGVDW